MTSVGVMASSVVVGGETLLADPCDNFTAAPWTVAGTPSVIAGGKTGNGFNMPTGGTNTITYALPSAKQTDTIAIGFWIKFATFATPHHFCQLLSDSGATIHDQISIVGTSVNVTNAAGTGLLTAAALTTGTWYRVEASVKLHDTAGVASLRVGGTLVDSRTGLDTRNAGTKTVFDAVRFSSRSITSAWQLDDIYVRNDATFLG